MRGWYYDKGVGTLLLVCCCDPPGQVDEYVDLAPVAKKPKTDEPSSSPLMLPGMVPGFPPLMMPGVMPGMLPSAPPGSNESSNQLLLHVAWYRLSRHTCTFLHFSHKFTQNMFGTVYDCEILGAEPASLCHCQL